MSTNALQRLVKCDFCLEVKASGEFAHVSTYSRIDSRSMCKACKRERAESASPAAQRDRGRRRRSEDPVGCALRLIKHRAKVQGIPFDLTAADVFIPEYCPILGVKLAPIGEGNRTEDAVSFDRLDPSKGYVRGNVFVMSRRANRIKSDATAEEHDRIAAWMRAQAMI